jgi:hypothetical protein
VNGVQTSVREDEEGNCDVVDVEDISAKGKVSDIDSLPSSLASDSAVRA